VLRSTEGPVAECALPLLAERLAEIAEGVERLSVGADVRKEVRSSLMAAATALQAA